jgi:hypothetical protein
MGRFIFAASYTGVMAHWVTRKGKYVSLEESYRNAEGKPRKRIVRYYGIEPPTRDYGVDWEAIERSAVQRQEREERTYQEKRASQQKAFKAATGLELPANPPSGPIAPTEAPDDSAPAPASDGLGDKT